MTNVAEQPRVDNILNARIREGRVIFDDSLARHTLKTLNYIGQRKVEQNHVDALAALMRAKLFLSGGQIAFGRLDGKLTLVNGQHRLAAIAASGLAQEFQVLVVDCQSAEEIRALFWRFDAVMRVRSTAQILNAADLAGQEGVRKDTAKAIYSAIGFVLNDMHTPVGMHAKAAVDRRVIDFRLEACKPFWPIAREFDKAAETSIGILPKRLRSGSVMAVILQTFRHQPERAYLFWQGVAANDGLRRGDPRHALVEFLQAGTARQGDADTIMGACAAAWNAFYTGRTLTFLRPSLPVRLKGTPVGAGK